VPTGRIEVAWTIDDETQRLRLTWTEKGGPAVEPPSRRSFGTRMMGSLGQQLNGKVELAYQPTGFVYTLIVPLSSLTSKA
jgi:two-component sensor histidine kinase